MRRTPQSEWRDHLKTPRTPTENRSPFSTGRYIGAQEALRGATALLLDRPPGYVTGRYDPDYVWAQFDDHKRLGAEGSPLDPQNDMPWCCGWHKLPRADFEIDQ